MTARSAKDKDKVSLPSGGWARLRDPKHLRAREVKETYREMQEKAPDDGNPVAMRVALSEALFKVLIVEWELPYDTEDERPWALPSADKDIADDLNIPDYRALCAAVEPALDVINLNVVISTDPESPTSPANG